ncbi:unnamed protein product [Paramecium octaurelia]|uniref:Uncharacterized protein n=1 Tax=Paramecium octaurelia TaxID=43137 RepID=A0A8S1V9Z7_PAROT|nr:unnamed protein product [Paramecium octaurelia]
MLLRHSNQNSIIANEPKKRQKVAREGDELQKHENRWTPEKPKKQANTYKQEKTPTLYYISSRFLVCIYERCGKILFIMQYTNGELPLLCSNLIIHFTYNIILKEYMNYAFLLIYCKNLFNQFSIIHSLSELRSIHKLIIVKIFFPINKHLSNNSAILYYSDSHVEIVKQLFLAFILDRNSQKPVIVASIHGRIEIEEVAKIDPNSIIVLLIDVNTGLTNQIANKVIDTLELSAFRQQAIEQLKNQYKMFIYLILLKLKLIHAQQIQLINYYFLLMLRSIQKKLAVLRKTTVASEQVDSHEELALAARLKYVALDGNIGCMVNGAGLALANMDIIKFYGEDPSNFLDVRGGANVEQVNAAFEILSTHCIVETILINNLGDILKCNIVAERYYQSSLIGQSRDAFSCQINWNQHSTRSQNAG